MKKEIISVKRALMVFLILLFGELNLIILKFEGRLDYVFILSTFFISYYIVYFLGDE